MSTLVPLAAADRRGVLPEDLAQVKLVSTARISGDGRHVAYVVQTLDVHANRYRSNIWVADVIGMPPRQITRGDDDTDPHWSPDGRTIAFVSGRGEHGQIFRISLDGGEALALTTSEHGASDPAWSHDGTRIAFTQVSVDPQPPTRLDEKAAGFTLPEAQKKSDIRTIDRLDFSLNGPGYIYNKHPHLYVMRADGTATRQVTPNSPWSDRNVAWSADDRTLAFISLRRDDPYRVADDLYTVAASGGPLHRIATGFRTNETPAWMPHESRILVTTGRDADPATLPGIASVDPAGGSVHEVVPVNRVAIGDAMLTDTKEGGAGCGPILTPDGRSALFDTTSNGANALLSFDMRTGASRTVLAPGGEIADCSADRAVRRIAYVASDALHLGEVWIEDVATGATRRLTSHNDAYLASVALSRPQRLAVKDNAGFPVDAWFLPALHNSGRAPTLLEIHGGPETCFGNSFFHELQVLAARGYNVVYSNPRGSVGYGYAFEAALSKNWGDAMFDDVMRVVDAVARRSDVDTNRLGVLGGSYGGYATLWVIAHTDRFKAAIGERPVSNLGAAWLNSDGSSKNDPRFGYPNPWDDIETNYKDSPIAYVERVHTPLLIVHSDNDIRTQISDTLTEYAALKALGRDVTYLEFPRENHDLSRTGEPIHRIERLHIFADYLDGKLKR